jgi:hypothetical protein
VQVGPVEHILEIRVGLEVRIKPLEMREPGRIAVANGPHRAIRETVEVAHVVGAPIATAYDTDIDKFK